MQKILNILSGAMKSRTVIVNVAVIVGSTLVFLTQNDVLQQYPEAAAWFASALAAVNVVLRMLTGESLEAKAAKSK